ncbi:hypothetical protein NP493_396g01028 [Ridgeia piscesae]|uniref:C-type lectin domain-containing protein n=1 Tax=Ridgeia piscesae TaxID=27915 RepID=A0AAD9L1S2_RIDPI|nr:hypothetical protein NP493_396g01028 [Ridgeia piscesae]
MLLHVTVCYRSEVLQLLYVVTRHCLLQVLSVTVIVCRYTSLFVTGLKCYSCSGDDCGERLSKHPDRVAHCKITKHDANGVPEGKCFIRRDPNDKLYWGCIDDEFWPGVGWRNQTGCGEDAERGWEPDPRGHRPIVWCFCQSNYCNLNVKRIKDAVSVRLDPCPKGWINRANKSCYLIVSPDTPKAARTQTEAELQCRLVDKRAHLVSLESDNEATFVAESLRKQKPRMLNYWQGWWTSAQCQWGAKQFRWRSGAAILTVTNWAFMKAPYPNTCVWVMQNPLFSYGWGNYDCRTKAGYICEVDLATV